MKKGLGSKIFKSASEEAYRSIVDLVDRNNNAKLLDCGCSNGEFTLKLSKKLCTTKIYGIEIDKKLVEESSKKGINIIKSDLNKKWGIKDNSMDVITASQVIEHLYDTDNFVEEIYRILKPNGYAIISTPNLASWHNIFSLLFGKQPFSADVSNNASLGKLFSLSSGFKSFMHLRIFTYSAIKELFEAHGFKVEKLIGIGYYPFPKFISRFFSIFDKRHAAYLTIKVTKEAKK